MVIETVRLSIDEVHFPDQSCQVARLTEVVRHRLVLYRPRSRVVPGLMVVRVKPRQQRCARRGAHRIAAVGLCESNALSCESIEIRCARRAIASHAEAT